jgi:hypothetical protein
MRLIAISLAGQFAPDRPGLALVGRFRTDPWLLDSD